MVIFIGSSLFMLVSFGLTVLGVIGYHGMFVGILVCLALFGYQSLWELYQLWLAGCYQEINVFNWSDLGNQVVNDCTVVVDLFSIMLVLIMNSGSVVVISFVYLEMWDDKEGSSFVVALVLFLVFMMLLASSGSLMIFYLGWEGMGLTSLFLINFWVERTSSFKATFKVFAINKWGDFLVTFWLCILLGTVGTADFGFLHGLSSYFLGWLGLLGEYFGGFIDIFIMMALIGGGVKSSQYGFHVWLLEAMEAPLGASALMHSSTLVVAGIVLVFRMSTFVQMSASSTGWLLIWGCWTAGFAVYVACFQYELKMVLAYSTVSSMGLIYSLLGLNAVLESLFYLIIHAFMKIFLFLIAGIMMFYCLGCQDIRWLGCLFMLMPVVWVLFMSGSSSMSGLPYSGGYYCKTKLWVGFLFNNFSWWGARFVLLVITMLTYVYLARLALIVFSSEKRGHWSIYIDKWMSWVNCLVLGCLVYLILFSGSLWEQLLTTTMANLNYQVLEKSWKSWFGFGDYWGWSCLMTIYLISIWSLVSLYLYWVASSYFYKFTWHMMYGGGGLMAFVWFS